MSLAKQLLNATAARDKLVERLAAAERAVTDHRQAAEALALDGAPDEKLDATEAQMRASIDRAATLKAALAQSVIVVANLEKERDEQADKKQRQETSAEVEALARRVHEGCAKLVADAKVLNDWTARAVPIVPEAGGILNFCQIISREIPQASDLIAKLLRQHGATVLAGAASPLLKPPPEAFVEPPPPPKPETVTVFALRSVKFKNADGLVIAVQKFRDVELPPALAEKALRLKACVQLTDPLRRLHHNTMPGNVDPALALDLDEPEQPRLAEPLVHSAFEKPVIGEAKILKYRNAEIVT